MVAGAQARFLAGVDQFLLAPVVDCVVADLQIRCDLRDCAARAEALRAAEGPWTLSSLAAPLSSSSEVLRVTRVMGKTSRYPLTTAATGPTAPFVLAIAAFDERPSGRPIAQHEGGERPQDSRGESMARRDAGHTGGWATHCPREVRSIWGAPPSCPWQGS